MKPAKLKPVLFTTSALRTRSKNFWFSNFLPNIVQAVRTTKQVIFDDFIVVPVTVKPVVFKDTDGRFRISHTWFENTLTAEAKKLGCNVVVYHFSVAERNALGLDLKINGTYWLDKNDMYECWVCADTKAEFIRIMKHEILHGLVHFSGEKNRLNQELGLPDGKYDDPVHYHDYKLKDLDSLFPKISYQMWGLWYQILLLTKELFALKQTTIVPAPPVLKKLPERLYDVSVASIGTDASPSDKAPDELACAETVSELINKVITFPIITGTWTLWDKLRTDTRFEKISEAELGAIIISPTGTGNGSIVGHTGICGVGDKIMSNSSATGKFEQNFTQQSWRDRYKQKGGFPIYYYRLKS